MKQYDENTIQYLEIMKQYASEIRDLLKRLNKLSRNDVINS